MSTGQKERRVIDRAVRVLDEIESRIHELREELEQNNLSTARGKKAQRDEPHDATGDGDEHEPHAQGRVKHPETEKRVKANKADHDAEGNGHAAATADDEHEPHAQGRVKHPESDKRLKANKD